MKKANRILFCSIAILAMFVGITNSCTKDDNNKPVPTGKSPVITTSAASSISSCGAISGGNIVSDTGTGITARGVCWSKLPSPTIADNKTIDGKGAGSFISSITGLDSNTLYYVRAYATNNSGTGYGNAITFTTDSASSPTLSFILPYTSSFQVDRLEVVRFHFTASCNLCSKSRLTKATIIAYHSTGGSETILDSFVQSSSGSQISISKNYIVPKTSVYGSTITVTVKVTDFAGKSTEKSFTLNVTNLSDINTFNSVAIGAQDNTITGSALASDSGKVLTSAARMFIKVCQINFN
jgi:hypothetical protein